MQSYSASRRSSPINLVALLLAGGALLVGVLVGRATSPTASAEEPAAAASADAELVSSLPPARPRATPPPKPAAGLDDSAWKDDIIETKEAEIQGLLEDNATLRAQVEHWQAEAARFSDGLDKAVAELNRVSGGRARSASAPASREYGRVSVLGDPRVTISGNQVFCNGYLYNSSGSSQDVEARVELLQGGRIVGTEWIRAYLGAGEDQRFEATFRPTGTPSGVYDVRVVFE